MGQYVEIALLAGIFFRMGGYEATFKWLHGRVHNLNKRVLKLEEEINELV